MSNDPRCPVLDDCQADLDAYFSEVPEEPESPALDALPFPDLGAPELE